MRTSAAIRSLALALTVLAGGPSCIPRPAIVTPAHGSVVDAQAPALAVEITLGSGFGEASRFRVVLLRGVDAAPQISDVTDRFTVAGGTATGSLAPAADLAPGRNTLFAHVDTDGDGTAENVSSSSFSYEPELDRADAATGCDLLDPRICLYPFPNDFFTAADPATDTKRRVAFRLEAMPRNVGGVPVDPTELNRNDGFSPGQAIQVFVPGLVLETPGATPADRPVPVPGAVPIWDLGRSLAPDASFLILDAETGERVPLWAEKNLRVPDDESVLLIRPAVNFASGRRYVVALRNLRDGAGAIIPPDRLFQLLRDGIPTYVPEVEARRPAMEEIFGFLEEHGVAREELYLAWDFTVISKRNVSERMIHIRDDAFARLGDAAPAFTVTEVEQRQNDPSRYLVTGTFQVPLYVTNGGAPGGSRLRCEDALGNPRICQGDELPVADDAFYTADFRCTVPNSTTTPGSARPSLYGHGLLGSQNEASASHVRGMADLHGFIFCGTRWIGMGNDDFVIIGLSIIPNFSNFPLLPDRMHQGFLNFLFLGRLMIHPDGLGTHFAFQTESGESLIDGSELFYDGNSQGAIAGGALAAVAQDLNRAVLGVPGMNYSTLLHRSVDFDPQFLDLVDVNYPDRREHPLLYAMAQMLWDRTETNGHANHLTRDPYPNTPAKKILLQVAFGDFQVSDMTAEIEARTIGAHVHRPGFDPAAYIDDNPSNEPRAFFPVEPFWNLPAIPQAPPAPPVPGHPDATYRWDGSALVVWDSGNVQSPPGNVPPTTNDNPELQPCPSGRGGDPHECPRRDPAARLQKSEFLATGGSVVDVCAGQACLAPGT